MKFISWMLDVVFPAHCRLCGGKMMEKEEFICGKCIHKLPRTRFHAMRPNPMYDKINIPFIERTTAFFYYSRSSPFSQLVQDFKYRDYPRLARYLGRLAAMELLTSGFFYGIEGIVPVPMFWTKKISRGYNQAEEISHGISEVIGVPVENALEALYPHTTQTAKTADERRQNVSGIFRVANPEIFRGRHILIVDDIFTTGSTMVAAVSAVRECFPESPVSLFTLGCTGGN